MRTVLKRSLSVMLVLCALAVLTLPAFASISYMPDVTAEMSSADFWCRYASGPDEVLMTYEQIEAQNASSAAAPGTMIADLKSAAAVFDGVARNSAVAASSEADAKYYFGWTYGPDGKLADWSYYQAMIDNCIDPDALGCQPVRYGIAVNRTVQQCFPSENPIWDDPSDPDFNYQYITAVRVNEPLLIYTTSCDGKFYLTRSTCCSGWVPVKDVAVCENREEWLDAWDISPDEVLIVTGSQIHTAASNSYPETSQRMLTFATRLRSVDPSTVEGLVTNRSAFHNYIVELPVRTDEGKYVKSLALIRETAEVHEGYLPLTKRNIAALALGHLGDTYGWGGMLNVEDCSGLVRQIYECFGLNVPRNGNWQVLTDIPSIDMSNMSLEEKCLVLDGLPLGASLCFNGHEMLYLGKVDGKYYVVSTVSSIMSPYTGQRLRTRDVMINTLDVRRANGQSWIQALSSAFMLGYGRASGQEYSFPAQQWYHDGVALCLARGLMSAEADGRFRTDDAATRAEAAQALWVLAGKPAPEEGAAFPDVPADHPYTAAISWVSQQGLMLGDGSGFRPDCPITRSQLATVLFRFAPAQFKDTSLRGELASFSDAASTPDYSRQAVEWACGAGLLGGTPAGELAPAAPCTRAQMAVILSRYDALETVSLPGEPSEAAAPEP